MYAARLSFGVPLLIEKREPRDATYDEVKNQVAEAVESDGLAVFPVARRRRVAAPLGR